MTRSWITLTVALVTLVPVAAAHGQNRCQQARRHP
jgi:hypothetical protein